MNSKDIFVMLKNNKIEVVQGDKYENNEFCLISNQKLYDLNQDKMSFEKVIELYKGKVELANVISNTFTIVIIDKIKNKLTCIQDLNGDTVSIYYYINKGEIILTNKLVNVINRYSEKFCLNKKSVNLFMRKGFIPSKKTLIENICKMMPKHNLEINLINLKDKLTKKKIKYAKIKNYSTDYYINEFKKIININEKEKNVFTTLSTGYDSNLIFRFLDKKKHIEAFSVGGIAGRDETIQVAKNIKNYPNTRLNVAYVSEKTLDHYPDLVYHLEGAMYERGIFLQYELANTIKQKKAENVILFAGEGADQIFSMAYYNKILSSCRIAKYVLKRTIRLLKDKKKLEIKGGGLNKIHPYDMLSYVITKKNGILMNDIGINYVYPYLSRKIIDIAYLNRYVNFNGKDSHKEACNKEIDTNILKSVIKVGGTTDFSAYRFKIDMSSR